MNGLDTYSTTKHSFVGIDWLNLMSSGLKAAGGLASGGQGQVEAQKAAAIEKAHLEEQKKAAEQSASRWKWIGAGALIVVGGLLFLRH